MMGQMRINGLLLFLCISLRASSFASETCWLELKDPENEDLNPVHISYIEGVTITNPQETPSKFMTECGLEDPSVFLMEKRREQSHPSLWKTNREGRWCKKNQALEIQTSDPILSMERPCPIDPRGSIRFDAALLIWQSKMWGFEFAGKSFDPTNAGTASLSLKEKAFVPDFAWRPGCKVDLGYDFGFDGWDLDSRWTFYKGEDTSLKKSFGSQIAPPGMGVVPLWFYPFYNLISPNQIRFSKGTMSWRHYFNSIDLEMGRSSLLNERLSMRLFAGLKGAWIRQHYRVDYENGTEIAAIIPGIDGTVSYELLESAAAFKNETWGGGPRAGFDSKWKILWGVSLIADASFSLLFSKIATHRDQNDLNLNTALGIQQPFHMYMTTNSHQLKPVAEAKLGLDWESCIFTKSIIEVTVAYELQYWWAQNELRRNYSHAAPGDMFPMRGDLQMHGLTAEVAYSY